MRVIKEVEIPSKTIKATVKKIETIYCDFLDCKEKVIPRGNTYSGAVCRLCNRDVCYKHKDCYDDYSSDYPEHYCTICYDLWIPARNEMNNRHEDEEDKLQEKIKIESLEKNEDNRNNCKNKETIESKS